MPSRRSGTDSALPASIRSQSIVCLRCRRSSGTLGLGDGTVGEDVRVLGALKVKGGPCGRHRLRATFRVFGGMDCEPGEACPDIA